MTRDELDRRGFLRLGNLCLGGISMLGASHQLSRAESSSRPKPKSVIMVCLPGGPSHIDMYDPKPDSPVEFRGEFDSISTATPGLQFSEHLPLQAQITDKFSLIRGLKFKGRHDPYELLSGYPSARTGEIRAREKWPVFGSIVSRVRGSDHTGIPSYINLNDLRTVAGTDDPEVSRYIGPAHSPFRPTSSDLDNLKLAAGVSPTRLEDRHDLLSRFDGKRREFDSLAEIGALHQFQQRALRLVTSGEVQRALDLTREDPDTVRRFAGCPDLLLARRLVEAGVAVVTVAQGGRQRSPGQAVFGVWDTHTENFPSMRKLIPDYDQSIHTLLTDLYDRGLDRDVLVVIWGEFGRSPRVGDETRALGSRYATGRGHWWDAGFAVIAGGGLRMGQVIGETDARAERSLGTPYTPQNVLSTIYHVLGIDPSMSFPDFQGRPVHLLDERKPIRELI